jgi:hypothetical protein
MNIAASLVESYMYADMFNRDLDKYEGGSEKVFVGGVSVEHILPALRKEPPHKDQEGGNSFTNASSSCGGGGPFKNKVIPAGLVVIGVRKDPDVQYEEYFHPNTSREVISDSMYDMLFASVLEPNNKVKRRTPPKHTHHPLKQNRSRKQKNKSIDIKTTQ